MNTAAELAELLNNFNIEDSFTKHAIKIAKDNNLVIITAISNDTITLSGSLVDEFDMLNGGGIFMAREGEEYIPFTKMAPGRKKIEVFFEKYKLYNWKFVTLIPHSTFDVKRNGKCYCKAIVFSLNYI